MTPCSLLYCAYGLLAFSPWEYCRLLKLLVSHNEESEPQLHRQWMKTRGHAYAIVIKFQCKKKKPKNCPYYQSSLCLTVKITCQNECNNEECSAQIMSRYLYCFILVKSHVSSLFATQNVRRLPEEEHRLIGGGVEISCQHAEFIRIKSWSPEP